MGRRAHGATVAAIVALFARRSRWSQLDLAAELDTTVRIVRRHLLELQTAGIRLDRVDVPGESPVWTWRTPIRAGEPARQGAPRRFSRYRLRRMHAEGLTSPEMATALGVSKESVLRALRAEGLVPHGRTYTRADPVGLILARCEARRGGHLVWAGAVRGGIAVHSVQGTDGPRRLNVVRTLWEAERGPAPRRLERTCDVHLCVAPRHREPPVSADDGRRS